MKKAVIFDFDGVIVDSEGMHLAAFNAAAEDVGFARSLLPTLHDYAGSADADAYRALCGRAAREFLPQEFEEFFRHKRTHSARMITEGRTPLYAATVRLIHQARERAQIAICSGAGRAEIDQMLRHAGLAGVFETIVSADDVPQAKPDPAGYRLTVQRLGLAPADCVTIEDTDKGIAAARGAGLAVVAVAHTIDPARLSQANLVLASTADLSLDMLLHL